MLKEFRDQWGDMISIEISEVIAFRPYHLDDRLLTVVEYQNKMFTIEVSYGEFKKLFYPTAPGG